MATRSVAELCVEQNIGVPELAESCGLDQQRTLAIALGRWTPSPKERSAVAQALGVAVDQVTWGHKTPIQHIYGHGPG